MKNIRREDWESLKPTVYGWGINDVNYKVQVKKDVANINGKRKRKNVWTCPYYADWLEIIRRALSVKEKIRNPTYESVSISDEWKYLSNFIEWVDSQPNKDWQNCHLDKDLLSKDKIYSPETCCYLPQKINKFINEKPNKRGLMLIGVTLNVKSSVNPYIARCRDFTKNGKYLGVFPTEMDAHLKWQAHKHYLSCLLAEQQQDHRVAKALQERYAPDKDWTKE